MFFDFSEVLYFERKSAMKQKANKFLIHIEGHEVWVLLFGIFVIADVSQFPQKFPVASQC